MGKITFQPKSKLILTLEAMTAAKNQVKTTISQKDRAV